MIEALNKYEKRKILEETKELLPEDCVKPSPATIYYWSNHYLKEITDLIIKKAKDEM